MISMVSSEVLNMQPLTEWGDDRTATLFFDPERTFVLSLGIYTCHLFFRVIPFVRDFYFLNPTYFSVQCAAWAP